MEKSIRNLMEAAFQSAPADLRTYSPLTLAYIGDAVYDVMIRTVVVERANQSANKLHKMTVGFVNAGTQAKLIEAMEPTLTEEEAGYYHRGRNAKSGSCAKNASIVEYRKATGFEALIGYWYLTGQMERAVDLVYDAMKKLEMDL